MADPKSDASKDNAKPKERAKTPSGRPSKLVDPGVAEAPLSVDPTAFDPRQAPPGTPIAFPDPDEPYPQPPEEPYPAPGEGQTVAASHAARAGTKPTKTTES